MSSRPFRGTAAAFAAAGLAVACLALAACGGGSGSSGTPVGGSQASVGTAGGHGDGPVTLREVASGGITVPPAAGAACPSGNPGSLAGKHVEVTGDVGDARPPQPTGPLYVEPDSAAASAARADPANAALYEKIASQPVALTVTNSMKDGQGHPIDTKSAVQARMGRAAAKGATAVLQVYAIPHRDLGSYSAGGTANGAAYKAFTRQVAAGIGDGRAIVVLEPDSLAQIDQLPKAEADERYGLLSDAVDVYTALPHTSVYLDGANCGWTDARTIANRLLRAGVTRARGFFSNVSNFYWTSDEVKRDEVISALTGGAHFVVDTSRNGRGPLADTSDPHHWCNPPGRGLGRTPTTSTGVALADAYLWVKTPGESDGQCGGNDPPAGQFWPAQALQLARDSA